MPLAGDASSDTTQRANDAGPVIDGNAVDSSIPDVDEADAGEMPPDPLTQAPMLHEQILMIGVFEHEGEARNGRLARGEATKLFVDPSSLNATPLDNNEFGGMKLTEDIILDQITFRTFAYPTRDNPNVGVTYDELSGDNCVYIRSCSPLGNPSGCAEPRDPRSSELWCGTSRLRVGTGYRREVIFPQPGVFLPAGTRISCPIHMVNPGGEALNPDAITGSRFSCQLDFHFPDGTELTQGKIIRLPYLDTIRNGTSMLPADRLYRGYSATEPLRVVGGAIYAAGQGSLAHTFSSLSLRREDATGVLDERDFPDIVVDLETEGVPNRANFINPGFFTFSSALEIASTERLAGTCDVSRALNGDCAFFALVEHPVSVGRLESAAPNFNDYGHINRPLLQRLCARESYYENLSPAGCRVLRDIKEVTVDEEGTPLYPRIENACRGQFGHVPSADDAPLLPTEPCLTR